MIYNVIGLMSGSSLDGLDIAFVHLQETAGKWTYEIKHAECYKYPDELMHKLKDATGLSALQYQLLNISYGHYIGEQVNNFIKENDLTKDFSKPTISVLKPIFLFAVILRQLQAPVSLTTS